jgi:hypothetical protein
LTRIGILPKFRRFGKSDLETLTAGAGFRIMENEIISATPAPAYFIAARKG